MKEFRLETERTYLRCLNINDSQGFYELNLNPEVLKFTGDEPFNNREEAEGFIRNYDQYSQYGVGRFAVISKQNDVFMGWCGLRFSPDTNEYDIGFRFFEKYWNQGFATETAKVCSNWAIKDLELTEIVGRAMLENKASIKVLEKLGMKLKENKSIERVDWEIYTIKIN